MIPNKDLMHKIARREHRGLMAEVTPDNMHEWEEYFKKEGEAKSEARN